MTQDDIIKELVNALQQCADALLEHFDDDQDGSIEANASNLALQKVKKYGRI